MKKLKLGFCRIKCVLSFHVKILVNCNVLLTNNAKIYLETQKFTKNVFFRRYGQNDGGSLEYRSFDHYTLFESLLNHVYSSKPIHHFISLKFMKKFPSKFKRFSIIFIYNFMYNFCTLDSWSTRVDQEFYMK